MEKKFEKRFEKRTKEHIDRVVNNAQRLKDSFPTRFKGLLEQAKQHDKSKFEEPERKPYIWLTEYYRCESNDVPFEYPEGMEQQVNRATMHHVRTNKHHPESHDPDKNEIELDDDRKPEEIVDATAMPEIDIAEMICDWAAMSQELGNSLKGWSDKTVNKRWKFTPGQRDLIYELVKFFESFDTKLDEALSKLNDLI